MNVLLAELTNVFLMQISQNNLSVDDKRGCYIFVKHQVTHMPVFFKWPIYVLLCLFFCYVLCLQYGKSFSKLPLAIQQQMLMRWQAWPPAFTLCRLLRSLVYLYCFELPDES